MTRTREEVQHLIDSWKHDPCWDLEDTAGFEDHRDELTAVARAQQAEWDHVATAQELEEVARRRDRATTLGCSAEVVRELERLEGLVQQQAQQIAELQDHVATITANLARLSTVFVRYTS